MAATVGHFIPVEDINGASDNELIALVEKFIVPHMRCTCRRHRNKEVPIEDFIRAIRRRANKKGHGGISTGNLPKSCDSCMDQNDKCNPVNNPQYARVRKAKTEAERLEVFVSRDLEIMAHGIKPRPRILKDARLEFLDEADPAPAAVDVVPPPTVDLLGLFEPFEAASLVITESSIRSDILNELAPVFEPMVLAPGIDDEHSSWRYC